MTAIVSGLLGGTSKAEKILRGFSPSGFSSAGLSGSFANNRFTVTRGAQADAALGDLRTGFAGQGAALRQGAADLGAFIPGLQELQRRLSAVDPSALAPELRGLRTRLQGIDLSGLSGARADLSGLRPGLSGLRGEVASLREQLKPGFGALTRSRVEGLRDNRTRAVGNLREELSRRRVLGSSFAQREVSAMEADFVREEDRIRAESMLQEIDATNQLIAQELGIFGQEAGIVGAQADIATNEASLRSGLIGQEAGLVEQEAGLIDREMSRIAAEGGLISQQAGIVGTQFETLARSFDTAIISAQQVLAQLNLETGLAAGLGESASNMLNANLTAQAQARAAHEAGAAEFLGTIVGLFSMGGGGKK